jgi:[ribosomal protein S18]-alanine N-acetyltransferase
MMPDAARLAALHAACFADAWSEQAIRDLLATPGSFALTAQDGTGFILVRAAGGEAEILTLAVLPAARRRGIGKSLVAAAAAKAAEAGAEVLFLEVGVENLPAIALYKQTGFVEVGRRKAYYGGIHGMREDALVLRVDIPLFRV